MIFFMTGTFHGSIVNCETEGGARMAFHKVYNGESITHVSYIAKNGEIKYLQGEMLY